MVVQTYCRILARTSVGFTEYTAHSGHKAISIPTKSMTAQLLFLGAPISGFVPSVQDRAESCSS